MERKKKVNWIGRDEWTKASVWESVQMGIIIVCVYSHTCIHRHVPSRTRTLWHILFFLSLLSFYDSTQIRSFIRQHWSTNGSALKVYGRVHNIKWEKVLRNYILSHVEYTMRCPSVRTMNNVEIWVYQLDTVTTLCYIAIHLFLVLLLLWLLLL